MIIKKENIILSNPATKEFLADAYFPESKDKLPLIIFIHGYKGYKDWGAWNLMGEKFAHAGFFFVKFNFSHNGNTVENPSIFEDLEAFGNNNYTKELSDLSFVTDYFLNNYPIDINKITLLGHSRGAGIAIVKTCRDERINALITLAGVDSLDRFPQDEKLNEWKQNGVYFVENVRTRQQMPHYYQFFEDFDHNRLLYDVESNMEMTKAHVLIIHGTHDETVSSKNAEHLHVLNPNSELFLIDNANHVFGASEPWKKNQLPEDLNTATEKAIDFLKRKL